MTESYVQHGIGGTSFVGPDAVNLFRAKSCKVALGLAARGIKLARNQPSSTRLLQVATGYTGKAYKRGQYATAIADLEAWIRAMECAMSVVGEPS